MHRRHVLQGLLAAYAVPLAFASSKTTHFFALARHASGQHYAAAVDAELNLIWTQALPWRGHAGDDAPGVWVVQRRPGTQAVCLSPETGAPITHANAPAGYTFNGHGAWLGDRLWLTANRAADSHGYLWRSDGRLFQSGGRGPHEIVAHGKRFWVANGGIHTDPLTGSKHRLPDFDSNLAWVDAHGDVVERFRLAHSDLSLRHLTIWRGKPVVAGQTLANGRHSPHYLATPHQGALSPFGPNSDDCAGYLGSVSAQGQRLTCSSPRAGKVFTSLDGNHWDTRWLADACAIAENIASRDSAKLMSRS